MKHKSPPPQLPEISNILALLTFCVLGLTILIKALDEIFINTP